MQKKHRLYKNRTSLLSPKSATQELVLYGLHPVIAAIHNPHRHIKRIRTCDATYAQLPHRTRKILSNYQTDVQICSKRDIVHHITHMVPENAPHQDIVAIVFPLPRVALETVLNDISPDNANTVVILDQICDPHNIGAILRSSAIFGAKAVIVVDKNSPHETGVLAKSASGALEKIPFVRVHNMKQCLTTLKKHGFWCVGLSGNAQMDIRQYTPPQNTALIVGAEGTGMRHLTEKTCDVLVRIHTPNADSVIDSLNVSNALAISLHHITNCTNPP